MPAQFDTTSLVTKLAGITAYFVTLVTKCAVVAKHAVTHSLNGSWTQDQILYLLKIFTLCLHTFWQHVIYTIAYLFCLVVPPMKACSMFSAWILFQNYLFYAALCLVSKWFAESLEHFLTGVPNFITSMHSYFKNNFHLLLSRSDLFDL